MILHVEADGSVHGTKITTEDGIDISNSISGVKFIHDAGALPKVEVTLNLMDISVEGTAYVQRTVDGRVFHREVKSITFIDGETVDYS